mmetsp:Transcript_116066/g.248225  ORF Transcript_116066/g.248225 Transcript_116066/m.248225 type:complete len:396 (+) Transcript_116066:388-1575(+)
MTKAFPASSQHTVPGTRYLQHLATKSDLAHDRSVAAHRPPQQQRGQGEEDGQARPSPVLARGNRAAGGGAEMHVQVLAGEGVAIAATHAVFLLILARWKTPGVATPQERERSLHGFVRGQPRATCDREGPGAWRPGSLNDERPIAETNSHANLATRHLLCSASATGAKNVGQVVNVHHEATQGVRPAGCQGRLPFLGALAERHLDALQAKDGPPADARYAPLQAAHTGLLGGPTLDEGGCGSWCQGEARWRCTLIFPPCDGATWACRCRLYNLHSRIHKGECRRFGVGVVDHDWQLRLVRNLRLALERMDAALLGQEVPLNDEDLLLEGVAGEVHDLHAVEERAVHERGVVCGTDEEDPREVEGRPQVVVSKGTVLLWVEDLEEHGLGIEACALG